MIPKFRAWDRVNKKMYFIGELLPFYSRGAIGFKCSGHITPALEGAETLEDFLLMQSAGLKDKNGVEIFEGDIVACRDWWGSGDKEYNGWNGRIEWLEDSLLWYVSNINDSLGDIKESLEVEIIGNIYQNPELLEG